MRAPRGLLGAWLALGACQPPPDSLPSGQIGAPPDWLVDNWSEAMAACGEPRTTGMAVTREEIPTLLHPDCGDVLEMHVGLNEASFAGLPPVEDTYGLSSERIRVRTALFTLMAQDLGTVEELDFVLDGGGARRSIDELDSDLLRSADPGHYARDPFRNTLRAISEQTGPVETQAAIYNFVTSTIATLTYTEVTPSGNTRGSSVDPRTREVYTTLHYEGPVAYIGQLAHEAAHPWFDSWHVPCPEGRILEGRHDLSGEIYCDESWNTTRAYEGGVGALFWVQHDPDVPADEGNLPRNTEKLMHRAEALIIAP